MQPDPTTPSGLGGASRPDARATGRSEIGDASQPTEQVSVSQAEVAYAAGIFDGLACTCEECQQTKPQGRRTPRQRLARVLAGLYELGYEHPPEWIAPLKIKDAEAQIEQLEARLRDEQQRRAAQKLVERML